MKSKSSYLCNPNLREKAYFLPFRFIIMISVKKYFDKKLQGLNKYVSLHPLLEIKKRLIIRQIICAGLL
ncbi:MAG: hypothetical protein WCY63_07860, partial [Weeksellaceae bacterium]